MGHCIQQLFHLRSLPFQSVWDRDREEPDWKSPKVASETLTLRSHEKPHQVNKEISWNKAKFPEQLLGSQGFMEPDGPTETGSVLLRKDCVWSTLEKALDSNNIHLIWPK